MEICFKIKLFIKSLRSFVVRSYAITAFLVVMITLALSPQLHLLLCLLRNYGPPKASNIDFIELSVLAMIIWKPRFDISKVRSLCNVQDVTSKHRQQDLLLGNLLFRNLKVVALEHNNVCKLAYFKRAYLVIGT